MPTATPARGPSRRCWKSRGARSPPGLRSGRATAWRRSRRIPASIARDFGVAWSTVWSADERIGRARVEDDQRVGTVTMVGFDETVHAARLALGFHRGRHRLAVARGRSRAAPISRRTPLTGPPRAAPTRRSAERPSLLGSGARTPDLPIRAFWKYAIRTERAPEIPASLTAGAAPIAAYACWSLRVDGLDRQTLVLRLRSTPFVDSASTATTASARHPPLGLDCWHGRSGGRVPRVAGTTPAARAPGC